MIRSAARSGDDARAGSPDRARVRAGAVGDRGARGRGAERERVEVVQQGGGRRGRLSRGDPGDEATAHQGGGEGESRGST
ncbi:hypothetical protein DC432_13510 [Microbacterium testaceum]|uniref:Uncharacterized protein n=1 Tax=Microbacterium testaceum TaxID=2033 RepID=A0A2T7W2I7_MICTE|nr:hypothetical protein DC432_13510 [Microbacterium testaceum]